MARPGKKTCEEPSCLHVASPRVDTKRPPLEAFRGSDDDDDDEELTFAERRFASVKAPDLEASRAVLTDCVLERCDLANVVLHRARLHRVAFVDCRLVGADFSDEASLEDVTFTGCTLEMATFDTSTLRRVVFTRCRLEGAAFGGARLERVAFPDSDLARCDLTGAHAPGGAGSIDLRGALLASASFDVRLLRALTLCPEDAATIVAALGVTVIGGAPRTACKE
jgi:uncharacterized protein YjbI with pentapeptide repeats